MKGEVLMVGEYLQSSAGVISYKSKETGQPASFEKLTHTILTAQGAVSVDEDTRKLKSFDVTNYKPPFAKGDKIIVIVSSVTSSKGVTTARGTMESLVA